MSSRWSPRWHGEAVHGRLESAAYDLRTTQRLSPGTANVESQKGEAMPAQPQYHVTVNAGLEIFISDRPAEHTVWFSDVEHAAEDSSEARPGDRHGSPRAGRTGEAEAGRGGGDCCRRAGQAPAVAAHPITHGWATSSVTGRYRATVFGEFDEPARRHGLPLTRTCWGSGRGGHL